MAGVYLINPAKKRKRRKAAPKKRKTARRSTTTTRRRVSTKSARRPKRRYATASKGISTMARKRRSPRKPRYTKNPAPRRRSYARRAASRVKHSFMGLNFKSALMTTPYYLIGMIGSKWLAKRFGGGADETDPESWTWASYLKGSLGAVATAFVANMVKRGSGQKVLEGGLALMAYEIVQRELISGSEWASAQFGAEADYSYQPGDVETSADGRVHLLGQDYQWRELPEANVSGEVLQVPGRLGQLEPVTSLGATDPFRTAILG